MTGEAYMCFAGELLVNERYTGIEYTSRSGDFSVDIIAEKSGKRYAIQVKRQASSVSRKAVTDTVAGLRFFSSDIAMVIANSTLSAKARGFAKSVGCISIERGELG